VSPLAATFEDGYRAVEIADTMIRSWQSARREPTQIPFTLTIHDATQHQGGRRL
jgi:hypothetical protein